MLEPPKKILVIQTAFIGDMIMSTPIFRELKKLFPEAQVYALAIPSTEIMLRHNPYIEKVFVFDKKKHKISNIFKTAFAIRKEGIDTAIALQHSSTTSLLMLLGGIKNRIGNQRVKFTTKTIYTPKSLHNRDRVLNHLKAFTLESLNNRTEIFVSKDDEKKAEEILKTNHKQGNFKLGISPGSVWETKKWRKEYFSGLVDMLKEYPIELYFFGSPEERSYIDDILENAENRKVINTAGELTLLESSALIGNMDLMLTNDSAPLHIANAMETDVYAFFGPTVRRFGCYPYRKNDKMLQVDLDCRPCAKHGTQVCPLGHHNCMKLITPQEVKELIVKRI